MVQLSRIGCSHAREYIITPCLCPSYFETVNKLDAALGIYDYLSKKVRLTKGSNQYIIKGLDFDKGEPIDSPPEKNELGVGLQCWTPRIDLVMAQNLNLDVCKEIPNLDDLIVPDDLDLKFNGQIN